MQRNHSIDVIRGLLLLLMTTNHFFWGSGASSIVQVLTLQPLGQVGAAEGFIFISGLMVGLIYTRSTAQGVKEKLLRRSFQIYRYHMLALIVTFLYLFAVMNSVTDLNRIGYYFFPWLLESPVTASIATFALVHKPPFFDILPMYVAFMLFSPWVIQTIKQGGVYILGCISVVLWLASDYLALSEFIKSIGITWPINTGYFNWLAWQMLFVGGIVIGYIHIHYQPNWFASRIVTLLLVIFAFVVFLAHHNVFSGYGIDQAYLYELADKQTLGWLRLACLATWVYLIGALLKWQPKALNIPPLALLGRNSLQVFTAHYVLIYAAFPLVLTFGQTTLRLHLFWGAVIAGLFMCAYWREYRVQRVTPAIKA